MPSPANNSFNEPERAARCVDCAALLIANHVDHFAAPALSPWPHRAILDAILDEIRGLTALAAVTEDLALTAMALLAGVCIDPADLLFAGHSAADLDAALDSLQWMLRP